MGMVVLASAASFHQQQHHHHHDSLLSAASAEHPVIPLLAAPCLVDDDGLVARSKPGGGIHLWQPAEPQTPPYHHHHHVLPPENRNPSTIPTLSDYLRKPAAVPMLDSSVILAAADVAAGGAASTCQDCGNQAKKDCSHRRCRSCCKSRGFDCTTHVKSTWVPAARRRERQLAAAASASAAPAGSTASTSVPKKPRLVSSQPTTTASHTSTSNTTPPRSFDTTTSHQDASVRESLPGQVRAPAVFKCVRVTSLDDGEDEYAYHAMVKIGGRVFKGFLHDHGLDDGGYDDDANEPIPNISELHLGNRKVGGASSSPPLLPAEAFGGSGGMIGGGTGYGSQIN